jgi:hypothetical protein
MQYVLKKYSVNQGSYSIVVVHGFDTAVAKVRFFLWTGFILQHAEIYRGVHQEK